MKKKLIIALIVISFMFLNGIAEDFKVVYYTLTPKNYNFPRVIIELLFNESGVLIGKKRYGDTSLANIDIKIKSQDLYKWDELKKNLIEIDSVKYVYDFDTMSVSGHVENNEKDYIGMKYKIINDEVFYQSKLSNDFQLSNYPYVFNTSNKIQEGMATAFGIDDYLSALKFNFSTVLKKYSYNSDIYFDGKNLYTVTEPDLIEGFPFLSKAYVFVSNYYFFDKKVALLNSLIIDNGNILPFVALPTIPKEKYIYTQQKNELQVTKESLSFFSGNQKQTFDLKPKEENFGLSYTYKNNIKQGLLLKNGRFCLYYNGEKTIPSFMGFDEDATHKNFVEAKSIKASSHLTEPSVDYKAENLLSLELKKPWVEGVKGQGIDEFLEFNKNTATGMYLVNGFVSIDRSDLFEKNSRVKVLSVESKDGKEKFEELLFDTAKPQFIDLSRFSSETIRLVIKEVYPGTLYDDTCIAGIVLVKE